MQFYRSLYQAMSHSIKSKTVESMYLVTQQRIKMNNDVLFRLLGYVLCVNTILLLFYDTVNMQRRNVWPL